MPSLSSKSSGNSWITTRLHSTAKTELSCNIRKVIPATLAAATNSHPPVHPPRAPSPLFPLADPVDLIPPGLTNATHNPGLVHLKLREIQNLCSGATVQVGVKGRNGVTDKDVDDLNEERNGPLGLMLVARIIAMVKVPTPTIGGRETRRAALLGGSDAVGVVLAMCDRAGKTCEVNRKGVISAKEPADVTNGPGNPDVSAEASGTEVNGWVTVAVPAEESVTSDELASQTYRGDGRQEGEKRQRWWPERKEPSSLAVVEVGGDGGCRKQIVLLSWHVNPSTPVQMEEGHVNSGYGGPRSPAMDMGDACSFLFNDVQPYLQL
ncbi:hypothetical protein BKA70DRAFT_1242977 [Coprinopsis sp. MPI-PUGE-AT-0042]|nr:hypothetical protein BKA70DRAFT_1242977 [Coprinopsis sp. MPI-PUGE-AT-0042]